MENSTEISLWGATKFTRWLSASTRLKYSIAGSIVGQDNQLNNQKIMVPHKDGREMMPTFEAQFSGGEVFYVGFGLNFYVPFGRFKNVRLGTEYLIPTYQNPNGIQMNQRHTFLMGIQYTLGGRQ